MDNPLKRVSFPLLVANIRVCYYAATQYPSLHQSGLDWYTTANLRAAQIAKRNKLDIDSVIGIIAALSPNNKWERNLLDAELAIKVTTKGGTAKDFKASTYPANKEKAIAIANGKLPLDILGGNKVRAFYKNISNPSDACVVTIDGHATAIALGERFALEKAPELSDKSYMLLSDAYRQATREINADSLELLILASQVQAVTWAYHRIVKGVDKTPLS